MGRKSKLVAGKTNYKNGTANDSLNAPPRPGVSKLQASHSGSLLSRRGAATSKSAAASAQGAAHTPAPKDLSSNAREFHASYHRKDPEAAFISPWSSPPGPSGAYQVNRKPKRGHFVTSFMHVMVLLTTVLETTFVSVAANFTREATGMCIMA
jgi:hypothetical protein